VQIVAPVLLEFGRNQSAKADANYRRSVGNFEITETFKGSLCGDIWIAMQKRRPNKPSPRKPAAQQFLELEDGAAGTASFAMKEKDVFRLRAVHGWPRVFGVVNPHFAPLLSHHRFI
jgi:hypothetical protein